MSDNYTLIHSHTDYSLLDSCTNYKELIDTAVENGMKAIAITEHGLPKGYIAKALYCKEKGIKFLHGVEMYLTERLEPKMRDNYHTVLIAKNWDGVLELNKLVTMSTDAQHFYYMNRISFDEFLKISDNIIKTSACLASPLHKLPHDHPLYMDLARHYDYLEVQPHNQIDQKEYNMWLVKLANDLGKPLIAGTDTHSSNAYKAECRSVLLEAKCKNYDDDGFDLTFKTYNELLTAFETQGALSKEQYEQAIENTNALADSVDDFKLDTSIKYPILYGSREKDSEKFVETVERKFAEKVSNGTIPASEVEAFRSAIDEELKVFQKLKMDGWMLSMSELVSWCKENGYAIGPARGSVGGSRVAYVTDIIDLDPEQWHTVFSRFCNEDREEIGDIDIDCVEADRPAIFDYITNRFGQRKVGRVLSYGALQNKGVIDEIGRCFAYRWAASISNPADIPPRGTIAFKLFMDRMRSRPDCPWSLKKVDEIKVSFAANEEQTRQKYAELFYYYDGLVGTRFAQSVHPAGVVISPITLDDNYGMMLKDGEWCLLLDMDEVHDGCGLAKYDFLILKTVQVVRDTCRYVGIPYPQMHTINFDDQDVWEDMGKDLSMIFQFESAFGADSFKRFHPRSIFDMSLVTACIRPSGASYRDDLLAHKPHKNPSELIDHLLADNNGYLVYQEDIIAFLQSVCGLSGSYADTVRRGIARKKPEILAGAMPTINEGYCSKSEKPREVAEKECAEFLKIIEDASSYMFGKNHSIAYCLLGYLCGYYRHYYPIEFITSYLNNAANEDDIQTGTAYANRIGVKIVAPRWGLSKSEYFYNKEQRIISKGMSSIRYMSPAVADELYALAKSRTFESFVDVLKGITEQTSTNSRQLDILIHLDFFEEFGNQNELTVISNAFSELFKSGEARQVKRSLVDGTIYESAISHNATSKTKSGADAKSYTFVDIDTAMHEAERAIRAMGLKDACLRDKLKYQADYFGHVASTGNEADRATLIVIGVYPLERKRDGKQFGYSVITNSLGSGKQSRFTIFNRDWNRCGEIAKGDIIRCLDYKRDGEYFTMTDYMEMW